MYLGAIALSGSGGKLAWRSTAPPRRLRHRQLSSLSFLSRSVPYTRPFEPQLSLFTVAKQLITPDRALSAIKMCITFGTEGIPLSPIPVFLLIRPGKSNLNSLATEFTSPLKEYQNITARCHNCGNYAGEPPSLSFHLVIPTDSPLQHGAEPAGLGSPSASSRSFPSRRIATRK